MGRLRETKPRARMAQVSVPVYLKPHGTQHLLGKVGQVLGDFGDEREGTSRAVIRILLKQVEE